MKKTLLATAMISALAASFPAQAAPFGIYDPRSLAMGGVGVTTATARNANFFNPAALAATKDDEDFAFNLGIAARAADPDKLADDIDEVEETGDRLSSTLDQFNTSVNTLNAAINNNNVTQAQVDDTEAKAGSLSSAITSFNTSLGKIDKKSVELGAFAGSILAIPSKKVGLGLYVSGRGDVGARFNYASNDAAQLNTHAGTASAIQAALSTCDVNNPNTCSVNNTIDTTGDGDIDNLQSTFQVRGALVQEVGLSIARRFADLGNVDIGLTPKVVRVKTFNYDISAQDTEIDTELGQLDESGFNFDVGVTKTYGESYKAGLVIKNMIGKDYKLAGSSETIAMKPQARLGVSHHTNWTTLGLDVDLTKNKGLGSGFDKEVQFVGVGAELDIWLLQLRLGYRHDLTGNYDGMPSVGLGVNLFGLYVDAAVAGNDKEAAASVQLGLNF